MEFLEVNCRFKKSGYGVCEMTHNVLSGGSPILHTPQTAEWALAFVRQISSREIPISVLACGSIEVGDGLTGREAMWLAENLDAVRGALVGERRFVHGTLDKIYGIGESDD
jgi:hypothetical protein